MHESAVSALQEAASAWLVHGVSGDGVPQSQGAQAAPAGHAGQAQTGGAVDPDEPPSPPTAALPVAPFPTGMVVVVVAMAPQAQLHAGQAAPTGHSGQLHVQVPPPGTDPQLTPASAVVPPVPVDPPVPPPVPLSSPPPQAHLHAGQT